MSKQHAQIFGTLADGSKVGLYELKSERLRVLITNYGGRIISVFQEGVDVVYGPKTFEAVLGDTSYCGAICGRVANRIAGGKFQLEGIDYQLAVNNGANHLHGGEVGFDSRVWDVEYADSERLVLRLISADEEENYPGNLEVTATYTLVEEFLSLEFEMTTDQPTLCNLTNHVYLNPAGEGTIDGLTLAVNATAYTPATECIPDGRILPVAGTVFDLNEDVVLGEMNSAMNPEVAHGYDHNFVLPQTGGIRDAAALTDPVSGRWVMLFTDAPGVQVYTGEYLPEPRHGIALEPQHFPDAIHYPHFPTPVLYPDACPQYRRIGWLFDNLGNAEDSDEV